MSTKEPSTHKINSVTAIIPCKNEARGIGTLVKRLYRHCRQVKVVDNNSSDQTKKSAQKSGAAVVKEARHLNGIGYGYAIQTGLKRIQTDYAVVMDGDDTYPINAIPTIINFMRQKKLDFVSCNRLPLKNKKAISLTRQLGIKILNWEIKFLYGKSVQDALSGMWVLKSDILPKLTLKEGGWDFSLEVKLEALLNPKIAFAEYHIHHFERMGESKQNIWRTGFGHFFYILKRRLTKDSRAHQYFGFFRKRSLRPSSTISINR